MVKSKINKFEKFGKNVITNNRKAMIHMTETLIVLLLFFMIMFAGIAIYYKYSIKSITTQAESIQETRNKVFLNILSTMPEFSSDEFSAIDTIKLLAFKQALNQNPQYYENIFGYKTIKISQIYPEIPSSECSLQNYPTCTEYPVYNNPKPNYLEAIETSVITSLYFPSKDEYTMGKITLTSYG